MQNPTTVLDKNELIEEGVLVFNNEHDMDAEAFELEINYGQLSSWDSPFKVFINGELKADFKSFTGTKNRVEAIIKAKDLRRA